MFGIIGAAIWSTFFLIITRILEKQIQKQVLTCSKVNINIAGLEVSPKIRNFWEENTIFPSNKKFFHYKLSVIKHHKTVSSGGNI